MRSHTAGWFGGGCVQKLCAGHWLYIYIYIVGTLPMLPFGIHVVPLVKRFAVPTTLPNTHQEMLYVCMVRPVYDNTTRKYIHIRGRHLCEAMSLVIIIVFAKRASACFSHQNKRLLHNVRYGYIYIYSQRQEDRIQLYGRREIYSLRC